MSDTRTAILAATISAVVTLASTVLGKFWDGWQRERERTRTEERLTLEQKHRLVERLSSLVNSKDRALKLAEVIDADSDLRTASRRCHKDATSPHEMSLCPAHNPMLMLDAHKELVELHAAFATTLQLTRVYFGKAVSDEIDSLQAKLSKDANWWELGGKDFRPLLLCMRRDRSDVSTSAAEKPCSTSTSTMPPSPRASGIGAN
jgi:hypothetical protein